MNETKPYWLQEGLLDAFDKMFEAGRMSVSRPQMDKDFIIRGQVDYLLGTHLSTHYLAVVPSNKESDET